MAFSDRKFSELTTLNLDSRDDVKRKHDEAKLRMLRQLASQSSNRQCFDCSQKGPTYVNATIGSFVCTKCSGLLRGLTPPHRVKSISMATFTAQEIELLKDRGNSYCSKVWLGLCDENRINEPKNEQQIKDFMVEKYEKKRYYLEPSPDRTASSSTTSSGSYVLVGSSASGKLEFDRCSQNLSENDEIVSLTNSISMKKSTTSDDSLFISDIFDTGKSLNSALSLDNIISLSSFSSSNDGAIGTGSHGSHGSSNSGRCSNDNSSNEFTADFNNANIIEVAQQFPSDCFVNSSREQVEFFSKTNFDYVNQNGENQTRETMNSSGQAEDRYAALKDLDLEFKQKQECSWAQEKDANSLEAAAVAEASVPNAQNQQLPEDDLFGAAMSAKNPFATKNPFNCFGDSGPLSAMRDTNAFFPISQSLNFQTVNGSQNPFKIGSVNSVDSVNAFNFNQHHSIMTGGAASGLLNGRNKNNNPFL